ncbi:MAG: DUF4430 domain-containing protein [Candidatus Pacebacteria bacterium]|nr:DUF4430 domain-containing protein [Candidatus Paceibacterota bacterium]
MKNKKQTLSKPLFLILILGLIAAGVLLFGQLRQPGVKPAQQEPDPTVAVQVSADEYLLTAQQKTTAFDLLKENAELSYQWYDDAVFITAINGKESDDSHYWAFYVNDQYAQQAANKTELEPGDQLKWVYEAIDKAQFSQ